MQAALEPAAGPWEVSNEDYHADTTHVSHSSLEKFRESIPLYEALYVSQTMPRFEATAPMLLGSAFDCRLLEPEKFRQRYFVTPDGIDRRTKIGKETWERCLKEAGDRELLKKEDFETVDGMVAAWHKNEIASKLLTAGGKHQHSIRWTDPLTGIQCKARMDIWIALAEGIIVDVKSAENPSPRAFARSAANLGYHRQDAMYREGVRRILGCDAPKFVFVVVGTSPPFEVMCCQLKPTDAQRGYDQNMVLLAELADRRSRDDWSSRWGQELQDLDLPPWA